MITTNEVTNKYGFHKDFNAFGTAAQTSGNFGVIFIAPWAGELIYTAESHETAGADTGTVVLDIVKCTSGQAISSGTTMLTSTYNLKSTANTPVTKDTNGGLATGSARQFNAGDRIAIKVTGTLTALVGVHVEIYAKPLRRGDYR